jgi:hypothetical protein
MPGVLRFLAVRNSELGGEASGLYLEALPLCRRGASLSAEDEVHTADVLRWRFCAS